MKKAMMIVLALVMVLSLAGCGGQTGGSENGGSEGYAQGEYQMIMQVVTGSGTLYDEWSQEFAALVEEMSGGRIAVEQHVAGAIVAAGDIPAAVIDGTLDASWDYTGLWAGYQHAAPLFTSVPGLFSDGRDYWMWMYEGGGLELLQGYAEDLGVKVFPVGFIDSEIFMWSNRKVESIDDLRAMSFRMMPIMGEALEREGFSSVFMPAGELIPSLETGALDGAEFAIPVFDQLLGFQDVADYYHYPGFHQPSAFLTLHMNMDWWNSLPSDLQKTVERACQVATMETWLDQGFRNIDALEDFEGKAERVPLTPELVEALDDIHQRYIESIRTSEPFTYEVYQSIEEFGKRWYPYKEAIRMEYPERYFE